MKIIYIDEYVIVCEKPSGTLSEGNGENSLITLLSRELSSREEKNTCVFPVHRLDKDTVGVTVFARSSAAAASLSSAIADGKFKKKYFAVLCGEPKKTKGELCDLLYYDRTKGRSYVVNKERRGVRSAKLKYRSLQTERGFSLVEIELFTGRTHQIRVQFASRGLPLAGDRRYGAPKTEVDKIALCAYSLTFPHPKNGELLSFTADVPKTLPWTFFDKTLDNNVLK